MYVANVTPMAKTACSQGMTIWFLSLLKPWWICTSVLMCLDLLTRLDVAWYQGPKLGVDSFPWYRLWWSQWLPGTRLVNIGEPPQTHPWTWKHVAGACCMGIPFGFHHGIGIDYFELADELADDWMKPSWHCWLLASRSPDLSVGPWQCGGCLYHSVQLCNHHNIYIVFVLILIWLSVHSWTDSHKQ